MKITFGECKCDVEFNTYHEFLENIDVIVTLIQAHERRRKHRVKSK